jgi:hypothetical protein
MVEAVQGSAKQATPTYEDIERLIGPIRKRTGEADASARRRPPRKTAPSSGSQD